MLMRFLFLCLFLTPLCVECAGCFEMEVLNVFYT